MRRPSTHEVGREAERIFEAALGRGWAPCPTKQDYGIDYYAEPFEGEIATGIQIAVQVRGKSSAEYSHGSLRLRFEVEKLLYYFEKVRLPVFIVGVDVAAGEAFYIPVQQYLWNLPTPAWRGRKSLTLRLPIENRVSDRKRFLAAAREASDFASKLASDPRGAVQFEQERLQQLDPRFNVKVVADESWQTVQLDPVEPVIVQLGVAQEQVDRWLCGHEVSDFTIAGSPLLESVAEKARRNGGTVRISNIRPIAIRLHAGDDAHRVDLTGLVRQGIDGGSFAVKTQGGLLHVNGSVSPTDGLELEFTCCFEAWRNQKLLDLPSFDELAPMASWPEDAPLHVEVFENGNRLFTHVLGQGAPATDHQPLISFIAQVARARAVAKRFRVNPTLTYDDYRVLNDAAGLAQLLDGGLISVPPPGRLALAVSTAAGNSALLAAKQLPQAAIPEDGRLYRLGDVAVPLGPTVLVVERYRVAEADECDGRYTLRIRSTSESAMSIALRPGNPLLPVAELESD